ncbi:MAG: hypothetical protein AAF490_32725, partial [Chloroflexota bacterium]
GQSIVALLAEKLSDVRVETLDRLGHMAPVTHPTAVNERIVHFLDEVNATEQSTPPLPFVIKGL